MRHVKNVLPILSQTAHQLNISIHAAVVGNAPDLPAYERVFQLMAAERVDGIVMIDSPEHFVNRASIVRFAAQYRMPTVYAFREFVQAGGLLSYGIDLAETGRRLAGMTVDIVSGKKPAEIPFYQHVKFQLSLNRATERTLGLEFPASVLATADEVIE